MSVYKNAKNGTWFIQTRYKTWNGETKRVTKRGFKTRKEAAAWERELHMKKGGSCAVPFRVFSEMYIENVSARIKDSTLETKTNIINMHLVPYFGNMIISDITTKDVMHWQNEMMTTINPRTGKPYTKSFLKTIHNQLSAMFNHAVKFYGLKQNPAGIVGNMGSEKEIKTKIWTLEQYMTFADVMMDKPMSFCCFEILYWCGLRLGEMLALTPGDINFFSKTISVTKTYRRSKGVDYITSPKTPKSVRNVIMPDFLCRELKEYLQMNSHIASDERMFPVTKAYIEHEMKRGWLDGNLPQIRIHDLRHSHVSLLINIGYSAVAIADRMGHESIDITYRYAHLFPSIQQEMASRLNDVKIGA